MSRPLLAFVLGVLGLATSAQAGPLSRMVCTQKSESGDRSEVVEVNFLTREMATATKVFKNIRISSVRSEMTAGFVVLELSVADSSGKEVSAGTVDVLDQTYQTTAVVGTFLSNPLACDFYE